MNGLHVEPLDGDHPLIVGMANCELCGQQYIRGDWVRKLPCQHKVSRYLCILEWNEYFFPFQFHRGCVEEWLFTHSECPIDGQSVHLPLRRKKRRLARQTRDPARGHFILPLTRALADGPPPLDRGQRSSLKFKGQETDIAISGYRITGKK